MKTDEIIKAVHDVPAPRFDATIAAARRRRQPGRTVGVGLVASVCAALAFVLLAEPERDELADAVAAYQSVETDAPLDFLLTPPGAELWSAMPSLPSPDNAEETTP